MIYSNENIEKVDARYIIKIAFFCGVSINLGNSFDFFIVGLIFAILFAIIGILNATTRKHFERRPRYSKIFAYAAIVPLAIFFVASPAAKSGISPIIIFIPGVYLLFLALLQERSRGNGGFESFVTFNTLAALLCSSYMQPHSLKYLPIICFCFAIISFTRRKTSLYKYVLFLLFLGSLSAISYFGYGYFKSKNFGYGERMAIDYYQKERVMGFDPAVALGSFSSNYVSKYNDQIVLRIWNSTVPKYFKAASYEKYIAGIWKLPSEKLKEIQSAYYQVDYAVFEVKDSLTSKNNSVTKTWVQSTIDNFGFAFLPYGYVGVAVKDLDSVAYFAGGMLQGLNRNGARSDWYYFMCNSLVATCEPYIDLPTKSDIALSNAQMPFLDSVIVAMNLQNFTDTLNMLQNILSYFSKNFKYSLQVENKSKEPLHTFWKNKRGFCEYYATLSTLILRRLGIYARYAVGFAYPESLGNAPFKVFRRKNSHAWVEVFFNGKWVIFDPTPPVINFNEPNWFNLKLENVKGRFAYLFHALKEGEWRKSIDSFQNLTQSFFDKSIVYITLFVILAILLLIKFRHVLKKAKSTKLQLDTANLQLIKELTCAEKLLKKIGLNRLSYESVASFINRIKNMHFESEAKNKMFTKAFAILVNYENLRWKPNRSHKYLK